MWESAKGHNPAGWMDNDIEYVNYMTNPDSRTCGAPGVEGKVEVNETYQ